MNVQKQKQKSEKNTTDLSDIPETSLNILN
jgi:hypothetical protein